jgi:hypothetical protein
MLTEALPQWSSYFLDTTQHRFWHSVTGTLLALGA